eukprot:Skav226236  [mRNA]  locus=scaffold1218:427864:428163:- [translate_table: standard]
MQQSLVQHAFSWLPHLAAGEATCCTNQLQIPSPSPALHAGDVTPHPASGNAALEDHTLELCEALVAEATRSSDHGSVSGGTSAGDALALMCQHGLEEAG